MIGLFALAAGCVYASLAADYFMQRKWRRGAVCVFLAVVTAGSVLLIAASEVA